VQRIDGKEAGYDRVCSPLTTRHPVTVIQAGPCVVTQIKTQASDGYNALQLGFEEVKVRHVTQPLQGISQERGSVFPPFAGVRRGPSGSVYVGPRITLEIFAVGERVDVSGDYQGRGFAVLSKRKALAGAYDPRQQMPPHPCSIGSSAWPSRVFKARGCRDTMGPTGRRCRTSDRRHPRRRPHPSGEGRRAGSGFWHGGHQETQILRKNSASAVSGWVELWLS